MRHPYGIRSDTASLRRPYQASMQHPYGVIRHRCNVSLASIRHPYSVHTRRRLRRRCSIHYPCWRQLWHPYGASVRRPYGVHAASMRRPYGVRRSVGAASLRHPCGVRTGVKSNWHVRTGIVTDVHGVDYWRPYGIVTTSVRGVITASMLTSVQRPLPRHPCDVDYGASIAIVRRPAPSVHAASYSVKHSVQYGVACGVRT
jgi:hypothetical protein